MSRRAKLAEMLQSEPNDPFLNYAFALETAKEDPAAALNLLSVMHEKFPDHIPAYFRHGQLLAEEGNSGTARQILSTGIQVARRNGDDHAAAEMTELLESL